ncbi:MAG: DUF1152 domain-containing protein [Deltaproteobacteria bacterium]|nr:DUF1152 domain-containing protein [Deltaproteobacteria bacterium]
MQSAFTQHPLFHHLTEARRILISGCGGGFDVYCGLPLAFALRSLGKEVVLSNLTFADPRAAEGVELVCEGLLRVDGDTTAQREYFPELYLARWLRARGLPDSVYCLERTGVVPLREAYGTLIRDEAIDAVILVDGGTDSLMRGDEAGLGTPHEDVASMLALDGLEVPRLLVALGFGVDTYHGVCHAHFLENTAALTESGGFLGTFSLLPSHPEAQDYISAVRYATEEAPSNPSIVNTSIVAAVEGRFGDHHSIRKTRGSTLFINPLMSIYWCYQLQAVVDRLLYKEVLARTMSWSEVIRVMDATRRLSEGTRRWAPIPF